MNEYDKFIGLNTHTDSIAVAVAEAGRQPTQFFGKIANTPEAIRKPAKKLSPHGEAPMFCCKAGPNGDDIYRQLMQMGHVCEVAAPSLIPGKAGGRVKTDRRDARQLARLFRAGELTPAQAPGREPEAMRDLTQAREDMKAIELKARQRLGAFLLRHGRVYSGKCRWTQAHFRWLETAAFDSPVQQLVLQEYVDAVLQAQRRIARLEEARRRALPQWKLGPVVEVLMALRGVELVTAMVTMAELGDITRFDTPRQLMAHLGLAPAEYSSGSRRRQGATTRTGNGHVRRVLVEASKSYRFPARKTAHLQRAPGRPAKRCKPLPGRRSRACAAGIGTRPMPASGRCWSIPRSPGNWPASSGPLHGKLCRGWRLDPYREKAHGNRADAGGQENPR